ncbi:EpsG family protein [Vibrio mediterranei]|uniref:EpsG family protein n=1 Tax=Vibrio mediterranei TaxID=689 RepID=UPI0038CE88B8
MMFFLSMFLVLALLLPVIDIKIRPLLIKKSIFLMLFFFLSLYAGLRGDGVDDHDYPYYKEVYQTVQEVSVLDIYTTDSDIFFWVMAKISNALSEEYGFYILVFIFALLSVLTKFCSISKARCDFAIVTIAMCSSYLYLHEFIQIRASLSIGLVMLASGFVVSKQKKTAFGILILAVIVHLQSIFSLLILFLDGDYRKQRKYDIALFGAMFFCLSFSILSQVFIKIGEFLTSVGIFKAYYLFANAGNSLMPGIVVFHLLSYIILHYLSNNRSEKYYYYLRLYGLSIFFYWVMPFSSVAAFRMLEAYMVFAPFCVSFAWKEYKYKLLFILGHTLVLFYFYMYKSSLIDRYFILGM